uniref:Ig-like domain-containing protein n=1 Tax=Neolamprologus brichardi TaxID=32507 RepID=A0A3Q4HBF5_NEOBR
ILLLTLYVRLGNLFVPPFGLSKPLGEPATLKCDISKDISSKVYWYRQSVGETLKLIVTLYRDTEPVYASALLKSRYPAKNANNFSKLTILETIQEDEGMYHCGTTAWGNTERTSNYIVVQQPIDSNPVRPGDTATLQCSVLSDSENKTCPGDHNVFWFRAGSNNSHPNIIYTDGNRTDQCEKRSEHQKRCFYRFSKNVSSSDAGTYYCAVATCGEILLGNGTTVELECNFFVLFCRANNTTRVYSNGNINKLFGHFSHWKRFPRLQTKRM